MQKTEYFCDICGNKISIAGRPPWYPQLCVEHLNEWKDRQNTVYTVDTGKKYEVWI